jgi:hypothetical protein
MRRSPGIVRGFLFCEASFGKRASKRRAHFQPSIRAGETGLTGCNDRKHARSNVSRYLAVACCAFLLRLCN